MFVNKMESESQLSQRISIFVGILIIIFPALLMAVPLGGGGALFFLIAISLIGLFYNREAIPLSSRERSLILVVLFFFTVYVINVLSFDAPLSELDNASRFIMLLPVLFYLRKAHIPHECFFISIAIGAISCGVLAFYQVFYLDYPRAEGIKNAVPFGHVSTVLSLMCLPSVLSVAFGKPFRALMLIGFLMGLVGSILSGTRGGWIAIPIVVLIILLMNPMKWGRFKKLMAIAIVFLSLCAAYFLPDIQGRVDLALKEFNQYFSDGIATTSTGLRLEVWRASIIAISESPIFGVGQGGFRHTIEMLTSEGRVNPGVMTIAHVHNEFISATLHRGLIGLISLMLIFFVPLLAFIKLTNKGSGLHQLLPMSGVILITSYMIFSLTDIVFGHQNTTLLYAAYIFIIYGMISSGLRRDVASNTS